MRILVLNAGSSSLKFRLFEAPPSSTSRSDAEHSALSTLLSGAVTGIGSQSAAVAMIGHERRTPEEPIHDHGAAVAWLFRHIDTQAVQAVGHRVVHGGERFREPTLLTGDVIAELDALTMLAPLHNPPSLTVIRATRAALGATRPMIAVFDTAFHAAMPMVAATYAIPRDLAARHQIRRYGFHGIAHKSLAEAAARALGQPLTALRLITLQLGNGCSAGAVSGGQSIDTSMGMTPLEGLVMGTRSGDLDPAIVAYLAERERVSPQTVEQWLNERSGLLGLSGRSNDVRALLDAEAQGDEAAALALTLFCYRVRKYIGAYLAVLDGADAVVFGGGIGEHAADIRARICGGMEWCGLRLDEARNRTAVNVPTGKTARISVDSATPAALVVAVDEESAIAEAVVHCLGSGS